MKKFFILPFTLVVFINLSIAQIKPAAKADTLRGLLSSKIKIDTMMRADSTITTEKFVKSDSSYRKLVAKKKAEQRLRFKTDSTDLKLTFCDFEKDANAMIILDNGVMAVGDQYLILERTKRIKIFNENGKSEANIRIEYNNKYGAEHILAVFAQTINFNNGKVEYTELDQNLIYNEHTNKNKDAIVFSMPNVKAGSVIEYAYIWMRNLSQNFPEWDFQSSLPTAHSEFNFALSPHLIFTAYYRTKQPFVKDTVLLNGFDHVWVMENIPSSKDEPFMRSAADGLQSLNLVLKAVRFDGKTRDLSGSWASIGKQIAEDKSFSKQFDQKLNDESELIAKAKELKSDDEKIAFLFHQVKTRMKWNEEKSFLTKDGIKNAWKKKSGNWGEINAILYHLLKETGIKAAPMLVSSRDNGKIIPNFPNIFQINKMVTYVPVDSAKYYVLDASDKYNVYNQIPFDLLNSHGLYIDKPREKYDLVFMKNEQPVRQVVYVEADIKPNGTMKGTAQIRSDSYFKANALELHNKLDEKKYKEYLTNNDNNFKITSLTLDNMEVDSLPLIQNIEFNLDLPGTDEKYIYFSPNLLTSLQSNPFISKNRQSDIDFGYLNTFSINGRYKIPDGYKTDALPKSINLVMSDKSISFKRVIGEQEGYILVHYVISYKKSTYPETDYPNVYSYFKKLSEILNEQIVFKKT